MHAVCAICGRCGSPADVRPNPPTGENTTEAAMASSNQAFEDFERAGWEDASTVAGYDANISVVTMQSMEALLDDARVGAGTRVLDVATGAGYVASAAARRGADA